MKRILSFALVACSMSFAHGHTLQVCTSNWAPYSFQDGAEVKGIHVDLLKEALESLHLSYQFKVLPWSRALVELQEGICDVAFSGSKQADREAYAFYLDEPLEILSVDAVSTKDVIARFTPRDQKNYPEPIGSPHGYSVTKKVMDEGYEVDDSAADHTQDFAKLVLGRVKTIIVGRQAYAVLLQGLKPGNRDRFVVIKRDVFPPSPYYVLVSKKFGGDLQKAQAFSVTFSQALKTVKESHEKKQENAS